jgi:dolichol-phosphate mannosyltransferase
MGGYTMAGTLSYLGAIPLYWSLGELFSQLAGFKLAALLYWWAGGVAAYGLGRAVSGSGWGGVAVGSFYLLSAQVLLRLAWVEHLTIVACYPFVPLAFWGLWRTARRGAPIDFILLATAFSLVWLSASKIGATLAIGLAAVGLGLFWSRPEWRPQLWRGGVVVTLLVGWLGILPVISLLREFNFMAVFAYAPFAEWQQIFSQPAVVSGLDRGGELLTGLPEAMLVARGGYYLTWLGVGALAGVVWWNWRSDRLRADWLLALRIFAGASLLLQWLSHGPRSVLAGQAYLLSAAEGLADPVILLVWGALIGACLLLWWLVPRDAQHPTRRGWIYAGLLPVYLVVPGFRLFELLPPLANLRAPDSFWILAGTCCWSVTAGLAVMGLLSVLPPVRWRILGGLAAGVILLSEASDGLVHFTRAGMPKAVLTEFDQAMEVLREQPEQGWVLPLSGRYFYMQTPWKSGKPLWTEAGHSNFMLRGMARLQALGWSDPTLLRDALRVGAVRYVLIDRNDPQLDRAQAERWEKEGKILYEGEEILLLQNLRALPMAYRATEWVTTGESLVELVQGLSLAEFSVAAVAKPGRVSEGAFAPEIEQRGEFIPLASEGVASGEWRIALDGKKGLMVLAQAWHPDWQARVDGAEVPVLAAWGALCAAVVPEGATELVFSFEPPWWYGAGLKVGLAGWGLVILGLLAWPWQRFWPEPWRKFLLTSREIVPAEVSAVADQGRPVVLIPTHNESASIERLLRDLMNEIPGAAVWVIDDASTDGTREIVRKLGEEYPGVRLIERPTKAGLGSAYREAMAQVLAMGSGENFSIVLTMDGDGSHHADDVRRLLERVRNGEADVAIGSRYLAGSRVENWPKGRLWLSRGATWYVRGWTGLPLTDATSGVKAMRVEALRSIQPESLQAEGYAFQIELHFRLWQAGFRLVEEPIVFTEREGGCSKMNPGIVREAFWRVPGLVFRA